MRWRVPLKETTITWMGLSVTEVVHKCSSAYHAISPDGKRALMARTVYDPRPKAVCGQTHGRLDQASATCGFGDSPVRSFDDQQWEQRTAQPQHPCCLSTPPFSLPPTIPHLTEPRPPVLCPEVSDLSASASNSVMPDTVRTVEPQAWA